MLFQRAASVSTSPLLWTGPKDRRVRLRVLSLEEADVQAQPDGLAVFLGIVPSMAQQAGWGSVRLWTELENGGDHGAGCACCPVSGHLGRFLTRLIQERARGECVFFNRLSLICSARDVAALVKRLHADPLIFSLYGLEAVSSHFSCSC